ncbi:GH12 family glycosyl hydrolase domain-containing protein [Bosea sp. PAMC 26642]|uniref:GH12 family glycosyl hydrolase domain-containing protein n=1 Tax=Bosea sp. (strain PAMC 26642) TaxID=1792307 RepID=UPI00077004CC|nr:hypothetical protein [Bosea sp. PAMC 26642]AMJ62031.1 hypothetical protein AXW83_18545 [Bosea sp. PAMC 26642]
MAYINAKGLQLKTSGPTNNWPSSSTGSETQLGSAGNDIFHGLGYDKLIGGAGDDTYVLWDDRPAMVELAGQGTDTIDSRYWGAVKLPDNIENLFLNSPGANSGTGNALNNVIVAGTVAATLDGLGGDDVLVGGSGADLFRVTAGNGSDAIMNFKPGHDVIQLNNYGVSSFSQLKSLAAQSGSDVVFSFANGEKLVVRDVALSTLAANDFGMKPDAAPLPSGYSQLTGPGAAYSAKGWYVLNNVWNPGTLVYGKDYSIDSSYTASDLTAKTTFNWSFPLSTDAYRPILAYPEVIFGPAPMSGGKKVTDVAGVFPVKVSALSDFKADYDVSYQGNTDGFNVSFDIWLTNVPNGGPSTVTNEVMIWVHKGGLPPYGDLVGTYQNGDVTGKIYVSHSNAWTYTAVILDKDLPRGEMDIGGIFDKLQSLGIVSANEYVASVELGAEVVAGTGSLTINNLDLKVQTYGANGHETLMSVTGAGTTFTDISPSVTPPPIPEVPPTTPAPTGDDRVAYSSKAALVDGGAGHDTLVLNERATVELGNSTSSQVPTGSAYVKNFESVDASGSTGAVTLNGSQSNNTLTGSAFADTLRGGDGDDLLVGGGQADYLYGGAGNDRIVYDAADVVVSGDAGVDTLVLKKAATVELGNFWSSMVPGGSAYVMGFEDVDASGSNAGVTLRGSQYNNALAGSAFADTMTGGGGYDTFVFNTKVGGSNIDKITDFQSANDKIGLDDLIFAGLPSGTLAAGAFRAGTAAVTAAQKIVYDESTGKLYYDKDGSGSQYQPVQFAVLENHPHITNTDFFVI